MKLSVEVTGSVEVQLAEAAKRLNVSPDELAAAALRDLVSAADQDFSRVADRVLKKNSELYRRLA
jgi:ParB-like chromosome segregation protein Spo0J